jgi:hypothetical protein
MRRLLFFSRLAFICNIFFVICFTIQLSNWIRNEQLESSIVILGYILGIPLNLGVNLSYLIAVLFRKNPGKTIPAWLIAANILFLVIQALYIFYLNDTKHT